MFDLLLDSLIDESAEAFGCFQDIKAVKARLSANGGSRGRGGAEGGASGETAGGATQEGCNTSAGA